MMGKNNLFAIDMDAVLRAISEANADLVKRYHQLMDAFERVPPHLETDEDIQRAKRFAEQLQDAALRCRRARLADTKPLGELLKRVEAFFKTMEKQASVARGDVLVALGDAGRRRAGQTSVSSLPETANAETMMVNRETGEVLGTTSPIVARNPSQNVEIPLAWHIDAVDRAAVDIEALRPFLTDAALLTAARAHLKAKGPHSLHGATYEQIAALY